MCRVAEFFFFGPPGLDPLQGSLPVGPRTRAVRNSKVLDELLDRLNGEAEALLHELNVTLPREIEKAVAQGDLSENSEYTAALERQQFVRARLDHISRRMGEISDIDLEAVPEDRIGFGSRVEVLDLDDDTVEKYTLAFGDYLDIEKAEISMASPIGKALLGKGDGDEVDVPLPNGRIRYRVIAFETLHDMGGGSRD
jgi:transcription elongation factor GreA